MSNSTLSYLLIYFESPTVHMKTKSQIVTNWVLEYNLQSHLHTRIPSGFNNNNRQFINFIFTRYLFIVTTWPSDSASDFTRHITKYTLNPDDFKSGFEYNKPFFSFYNEVLVTHTWGRILTSFLNFCELYTSFLEWLFDF